MSLVSLLTKWFTIQKIHSKVYPNSITMYSLWRHNFSSCFSFNMLSFSFFFSIRVFFHGHRQLTGQQGKGEDHLLFHSTTSTRSHIFNRNACKMFSNTKDRTSQEWNIQSQKLHTTWKVSKYEDFSGPYFLVFGLNTERYSTIQSKYRKMRTRKNFVLGHFSRSDILRSYNFQPR